MIEQIQWLGHGSFLIQGPPLIYINPWKVIRTAFHADVILIGHDHYEHFSPADIDKLKGDHTRIISNESVASELQHDVTVLKPWHTITVDRAGIKAVPAYSPEDMRHPPEANGLGFIISMNYYDIYYAGDTGRISEMENIRPDIAILPIDNNGTLSVEQAAKLVDEMRPRWTIPYNWGTMTDGATLMDAQEFKSLVGGRSEVIIPQRSS